MRMRIGIRRTASLEFKNTGGAIFSRLFFQLVCLTGAVLILSLTHTANAQVAPGLGYAFPPSLRIGSSNDVQLGVYDFTPDLQWFVYSDMVKLQISGPIGDYMVIPPPYWTGPRTSTPAMPISREVEARMTVDPRAQPGVVRWQVANANGSSRTAMMYLSRDPEIVEKRSRELPQPLPELPIAVSGRLSRLTEVDRYSIIAEHDGLVTVELLARQLGSDFNGVLQVHDSSGRILADLADTEGRDGSVTFAVTSGKKYLVGLHDVDFRGDPSYVYRLFLRYGGRVIGTIPSRGQRGTTSEVEFRGIGLVTGKLQVESVRELVTFPSDTSTSHHDHTLETLSGRATISIPLSDMPETAVSSISPSPRPISEGSCGLTGVFQPNLNSAKFPWNVKKNEEWSVTLESHAVGGSTDVSLTILDSSGKQIAQNDDLPGTSDAGLTFRAASSGVFTCVARSLGAVLGTGEELFRVEFKRQEPDFSLTTAQQVNLPSGGSTAVTVTASRLGGFSEAIALKATGLPTGVTAVGEWLIPAGKSSAKVTLSATADAAVIAGPIQIDGSGLINDVMVTKPVMSTAVGTLVPRSVHEQQARDIMLAMTMPPPFELLVVDRERQREVHRGTTYLAELSVTRKDGFSGEVQVHMTAKQARYRCGISGSIVRIPPGATRAHYPCTMPEWLGTELTRRMVVHGVAAVADPQGNKRFLTKSAGSRITMIMEGALMKLSVPTTEMSVQPGESFAIPVSVSRSAKLALASTIELVVPMEMKGFVYAEPLVLEPGTAHGMLRVHSTNNERLAGQWALTVTATAMQNGTLPVVSQDELPVVFQRP